MNQTKKIILYFIVLLLGITLTPLQGQTVAYVANLNSNNVSVIDIATNTVTNTISVGDKPRSVAITPDGAAAYVTNRESNSVSVIDVATSTVSATVAVGAYPNNVAITPDGTAAYVTNRASNSVSVIDVATNTVISTITVGNVPNRVAITPDGATAYVTNQGSDNVSVIDVATNTVTTTIAVGNAPSCVAITPDGATVYVANRNGPQSIWMIDVATNTVTPPEISLSGIIPLDIVFSPDGTSLYVTSPFSNTLAVDVATNTVTTSGLTNSLFLAFTPDGATAYLLGNNSVLVVDVATNTHITNLFVGSSPSSIAFSGSASPADKLADIISAVIDLRDDSATPAAATNHLNDALAELQDALNQLNINDAYEAFKGLEDGIEDLQLAEGDGANVTEIIEDIYDLADELAQQAYATAQGYGGSSSEVDNYISDGEGFLANALAELANGHPDQAVRRLGSAYQEFQWAIQLGSAIAEGTDAIADVNATIADVQDLIDNGGYSSNANADLQDAIDEMDDAIAGFNDGDIYAGLSDLRDAVEELQDAESDGATATTEIDAIVVLAKALAEAKVAEAQAFAGNPETDSRIAAAQADLADAESEIADGDYDRAVKEYRDAWYDARIGLEHGRGLRKTDDDSVTAALPANFVLEQNYPNPFNPSTTIAFSLPEASSITLRIYNINGQLVRTLLSNMLDAGNHSINWDGRSDNGTRASSGIYIYRVVAGDFSAARRMILLK